MTTSLRLGTSRIIDKDDDNRGIGTLYKKKTVGPFAGRIVVPIGNRRVNQMAVQREKDYYCTGKDMWSSAKELWHCMPEHKCIPVLRDVVAAGKYGIREKDKGNSDVWKTCVETKNTKAVYDGNLVQGTAAITVYADMCVPMANKWFCGYKYFAGMIAAPHKYTRVKLTNSKTDAFDHCLDWIV